MGLLRRILAPDWFWRGLKETTVAPQPNKPRPNMARLILAKSTTPLDLPRPLFTVSWGITGPTGVLEHATLSETHDDAWHEFMATLSNGPAVSQEPSRWMRHGFKAVPFAMIQLAEAPEPAPTPTLNPETP